MHVSAMQSEGSLYYIHELEIMFWSCVFIWLIHKVNEILIKTKSGPFEGIGKLILKLIWTFKGLNIAKTVLKKRKTLEDFHFLILTLTVKPQYWRQCGILLRTLPEQGSRTGSSDWHAHMQPTDFNQDTKLFQ